MKRLVAAAAGIVLIAVAALFVAVEVGAPLGGLTHSEASNAARNAIHEGPLTERWALPGPFLLFRDGSTDAVSPWRRMVWAVSLNGDFRGSCGPARTSDEPLRCPVEHTVTVVIDYASGEFIQADYGP